MYGTIFAEIGTCSRASVPAGARICKWAVTIASYRYISMRLSLRKDAICVANDLLKDALLVRYTVQEPTCVVGSLDVRMCPHRVHLYVHALIVICTVLARNLRGLDSICLLTDCRSTQMGAWWQGCASMWARCGNDCTRQQAVACGSHAPFCVHLYVHASIVICAVLARNLRGLDSSLFFVLLWGHQTGSLPITSGTHTSVYSLFFCFVFGFPPSLFVFVFPPSLFLFCFCCSGGSHTWTSTVLFCLGKSLHHQLSRSAVRVWERIQSVGLFVFGFVVRTPNS